MGAIKRASSIDYDVILKYIGQCGKWQWINFFWLWLTSAAGGLAVVVWVFTAFTMKSRCVIPYCEELVSATYYDASLTNSTLPSYVLHPDHDQCKYMEPKLSASPSSCSDYMALSTDELVPKLCTHADLIFDDSIVQSSLKTEYGLTCNKLIVDASILGASYMLGMLFGSFILGLLSDKYGRLKTLMVSVVLVSASGFIGAFMPNAIGFGFLRFITGMGGIGCFMITFVLAVEFVGAKYTMLIGIAIEIPFALGEMILGIEAYFIRDWKTLQIVAYAPMIVFLFLWFVLTESPRWLLATGQTEKALKIIRKGAKINKRSIPDHVLQEKSGNNMAKGDSEEEIEPHFWDLFRPRLIAIRTMNMSYQWFSVTMCYYGLSFASTNLSGDPYSNFALSVFIEIPSYFFCIFVMDCWGRRPILSFCQGLSGVACILAGLLYGNEELAALQVILSLAGKFGASACFAIVYVYTAELFPTIIRNTAVGFCSTIARMGGITALLIQELNYFWGPLPMVIMGVVAIVAGILAIFFPETVGHTLPETMEDAIAIGGDSKRGLCTCICPKNITEMFAEEDEEKSEAIRL